MNIIKERVSYDPPVKRVAAIHDLSGFGRSSLTIAIPTLSAMGIQVCPLPTAVLSSQTAGISNFTFFDLTEQMEEMLAHWQEVQMSFDAVYSGFLGSAKQVELVKTCMNNHLKPSGLFLVDPVLGDDGQLYPTQTEEIVQAMRKLVSLADIITPNFTEACLLLGETHTKSLSQETLKDYLVRLATLQVDGTSYEKKTTHDKVIIITGVPASACRESIQTYKSSRYSKLKSFFGGNNFSQSPLVARICKQNLQKRARNGFQKGISPFCAEFERQSHSSQSGYIYSVAYEKETDCFWKIKNPQIPVSYPGTGDTFASVLLGALLQKEPVPEAVARACSFVYEAILVTERYNLPTYEGILLEKVLPSLKNQEILEYEVF